MDQKKVALVVLRVVGESDVLFVALSAVLGMAASSFSLFAWLEVPSSHWAKKQYLQRLAMKKKWKKLMIVVAGAEAEEKCPSKGLLAINLLVVKIQ